MINSQVALRKRGVVVKLGRSDVNMHEGYTDPNLVMEKYIPSPQGGISGNCMCIRKRVIACLMCGSVKFTSILDRLNSAS